MRGYRRTRWSALLAVALIVGACAPPPGPGVPLPDLEVPDDFTVVAPRWFGADVTWVVSATSEGSSVPVTCDKQPGYYAVGSHLVTCWATNSVNGTIRRSFLFHVVENPEPEPLLMLPNGAAATSVDGVGATVAWTATALIGPSTYTTVSCTPGPGYLPIGETLISCSAGSPWGATSSGSFTATVRERIVGFSTGGPTCAVRLDGTVRCAPGTSSTDPTGVDIDVADVVAMDRSHTHACYLLADQTVACSGKNESGQLGNGTNVDSVVPVAVTGITGATSISVARGHSCAGLSDGTARCWGANVSGQLGNGTTVGSNVPVVVAGLTNVVDVAAGGALGQGLPPDGYLGFACAALADGTARCWGENSNRQLGDGTVTNRVLPATVVGVADAVDIDAGERFACVRRTTGGVTCWGDNSHGQLGDGTFTARAVPTAVVGLSNVTQFTSGYSHSCAVRSDASVRCWGAGGSGRLGNGSFLDAASPVVVTGLTGVASVYAGAYSTCAVRVANDVRCWGYNEGGELGNGAGPPSAVPISGEF